jgi:hypothetical protein
MKLFKNGVFSTFLFISISQSYINASLTVSNATITFVNGNIDPSGQIGYGADEIDILTGTDVIAGSNLGWTAGIISGTGGNISLYQTDMGNSAGTIYLGGDLTIDNFNSVVGINATSVVIDGGVHNLYSLDLYGGLWGADYVRNCLDVSISDSIINIGTNSAFVTNTHGPVNVFNSTFTACVTSCSFNMAGSGPPAIYPILDPLYGGDLVIDQCSVLNEGCFIRTPAITIISNSSITNLGYQLQPPYYGYFAPANFCLCPQELHLTDTSITNNGVFAHSAGTTSIFNCNFINQNISGASLPAFSLQGAGPITISGSSFIWNNNEFAVGAKSMYLDDCFISNNLPGRFGINLNFWQGTPSLSPVIYGTFSTTQNTKIFNSGILNMGQSTLQINGGSITNIGQIAQDGGPINFLSGTLFNGGFFGRNCQDITIMGGYINNVGSLGIRPGSITVSGHSMIVNGTTGLFAQYPVPSLNLGSPSTLLNFGQIGPCNLKMSGGSITNNGVIFLAEEFVSTYLYNMPPTGGYYLNNANIQYNGSPCYIDSGVLIGTGEIILSGTAFFDMPITQGTVTVGYAFSPSGNSYAKLYNDSLLNSNIIVTGSGSLFSIGTISGDVHVLSHGQLNPGGLIDPIEPFSIVGNLTLDEASVTNMDFGIEGNDKIFIHSGNLNLINHPTLNLNIIGTPPFQDEYVLFELLPGEDSVLKTSWDGKSKKTNLLANGLINGTFKVIGNPPLIEYCVQYRNNQVTLNAGTLPFTTVSQNFNQQQVALALEALIAEGASCSQTSICDIQVLDAYQLYNLLDELEPSEYKGQQLAFEELVFVINDSASDQLYNYFEGSKPFIDLGYEHLSQKNQSYHSGYKTDAGYELLGLTYGRNNWQILLGAGALQTSTNYKLTPSKSSSNSVIGVAGVAGFNKGLSYGIDALFGYHFLKTKRTIDYFGYTPQSSHESYDAKAQGRIQYEKKFNHVFLVPHEEFAYLFNHENSFNEQGAGCYSIIAKASNQNVIRNTIGFKIKSATHKNVKPFIDLSYVYEDRFGGFYYHQHFKESSFRFKTKGIVPTKNYFKFNAGFNILADLWDVDLQINGQYGKRFSETGVNLQIDRRF